MAIETTKENMCINRLIGEKTETRTIEEDSIVPDIKPDILSVIMTSGNAFIYKKEILEGKIKIDGTIQTYIVYLSDDEENNTRTLQCNLDFSETIPLKEAMPGMDLTVEISINSIEAKILNGRKINTRVSLNFHLKLYSNENVDIISEVSGAKDIQKLNKTIEINSVIGKGSTKAIAKETIAIDPDDNLAEIMSTDIQIVNKDLKVSYNKVLAKADCVIKILYLTEDNRVKYVESIIPVMGFIEILNISDNHLCDVNYELKNFIIKPNNEEEHSVYVEAEVEIMCSAFEKKSITYIEDLYSPIKNINYTVKKIKTMDEKLTLKNVYNIKEKVLVHELNENNMYYIRINPEISSKKILNEKIIYEGRVVLDILYGQDNSRLGTKEISIPLQYTMEVPGVNDGSNIDTNLEIKKQEFNMLSDGQLDVNLEIIFDVNVSSFSNIAVIDDLTESDEQREENYNLIIYFVKKGDTVWKIAKKFGSTIDEIVKINDIENPDILQVRYKIIHTKI